jgi:alpha-tubulin suppressor-like RCC1 family protein
MMLALKNDGSIVCWGRNNYGQASRPVALLFFVRPVNFERVFPGLIIVLVFVRLFSF